MRPLIIAAIASSADGRTQRRMNRVSCCASKEDKKDNGLNAGTVFAIQAGSIMTPLIKSPDGWNIFSIQAGNGPAMSSRMATIRKNIRTDQRNILAYLLGIIRFSTANWH